jgi:hypothetical protein
MAQTSSPRMDRGVVDAAVALLPGTRAEFLNVTSVTFYAGEGHSFRLTEHVAHPSPDQNSSDAIRRR